MDKPKILPGHILVAKGITKIDASLPEIGLKDVIPNGSWLEQKQIQAALEARKHLVEVERIEKSGTLSHAIWRDDMQLAEVTQKVGGYWQFFGHNVGKTLYLRPEEALFLMEVNCLLLKHNDITVSLQKAYSLILNETISFIQYRVYASLSRLGYKVFKHKLPKINEEPSCFRQTINLVNTPETSEKQPAVDTIMVENILKQPLSGSVTASVEIIDINSNVNLREQLPITNSNAQDNKKESKAIELESSEDNKQDIMEVEENESKFSNIPESNIGESSCMNTNSVVFSEKNDCESSNINTNTVAISENNDCENLKTNTVIISKNNDGESTNNDINSVVSGNHNCESSNIDTTTVITSENNNCESLNIDTTTVINSENNNCESLTTNTVDISNNFEANHSQSTQNNKVEFPIVESENNRTENESVSMELDDAAEASAVTALVSQSQNDIKSEASSTINLSTVEHKNKFNPNAALQSVDVDMEDNNIGSTEMVHKEIENKPMAMDVSYECFQAAADSTVQSNESALSKSNHANIAIEVDSTNSNIVEGLDTPNNLELTNDDNMKIKTSATSKKESRLSDELINRRNQLFQNYVTKLKGLTSRQHKPSDFKTLEKHFENIPDLLKKEVISINVPEQQYIPKNIFVNNSSYVLNMKEIKRKSKRCSSTDSAAYNSSDEVNGNHVRRLRNTPNTEISQNINFGNRFRFPPQPNFYFRPYTFWRPQNNLNYVQFNMFLQRPCYRNMNFQSRFQYQPRPIPLQRPFLFPDSFNPNNPNVNINTRNSIRNTKAIHLESIKNFANRLKQLIMCDKTHVHNIESLHRLLHVYNVRYKARLRLNKEFDVINDETIVETIDLEDDDDESKSKRPRLSQDGDKFNENLNLLRQLAIKFKDLETKERVTSQHKRALSKALKTFNKSYNADIYMNSNFEIIDKRYINIASDSEPDCVVNEPQKVYKRKKLRNPFNILKRRSELEAANSPSTSKDNIDKKCDINNIGISEDIRYNQHLSKIFNENWLPHENDFGRAEVVKKNAINSRFMDVIREEHMFNFMKSHFEEFNNWFEAKIAFLQHMEEADIAFQNEYDKLLAARESLTHSGLKPLIDPEDSLDTTSILEKLRIIKNNKEINFTTTLSIDFDVYNRDVQNYKKTNPPKPHFRIVCIEESSPFPSSTDVMALHSKYDDNVSIVFAIVGIGSISYLQINPTDLPIYIASADAD